MLRLNNVQVIYGDVILVLKGLSLEVPERQIVALLGANGAGKTTTLKAISGLLKTEDGAAILMTYSGIGAPKEGGFELRTAPQFETGDERYTWLNSVQAVATGRPSRDSVTYEVYALL